MLDYRNFYHPIYEAREINGENFITILEINDLFVDHQISKNGEIFSK